MYTNNHNASGVNPIVRALQVLVLSLGALFAMPAHALDTGDIVVTSLKGEVHVTMNGAARSVRAGGVLELPATIKTGRDGAIELKQGATTVSVGPETQLEFPALEKAGGSVDRIVQPRGNAFYSIGKRDGHKLRVEAPYLVGVIKGTQFNVAAADAATTISLFEGLLEVHATDESDVVDLKAGEIASRKRGDKSISVIKMDGSKMPPRAARAAAGESPSNGAGGNSPAPGTSTSAGTTSPSNGDGGSRDGNSRGVIGGVGGAASSVLDTVNGVVAATGNDLSADLSVRGNGPVGAITALDVNANVANVVDVSSNTSVGVGLTGVDVASNTGIDAGVASVNAGVTANVDLTSGTVDAGVATSVAAGPVNVDLGTNAAVDVGAGTVAANVNAGVGAGPVTTDVGATAAVNLSTGTVDAATSTSVGAGALTTDVGTSTAVDLGAGSAVTAVNTSVAGVDAGVGTAVNVATGTVDLGVNVAGVDLNLGVDLGLGDNNATTTTDTGATVSPPGTDTQTNVVTDVGGLLDGLFRRPGRK